MSDDIPWDELFEMDTEGTTQNIPSIMQGYCEGIETGSEGTVHARFVELKMSRRTPGISFPIPSTGIGALATSIATTQEPYQSNALEQRDINEVYRLTTYVFDIYNDTYQFRLCELTYGVTYPIEVSMDEGVEEEIIGRLTSKYESQNGQAPWHLANDDELKECFRLMITSTKSKHILRQLRQG